MSVNPLIVCGTGRSGTTIFTKLIGCHSDVWAFKWESQLFSGIPGFGDLITSDFHPRLVERFPLRVKEHLFKRTVTGAKNYDAGLFEIISKEALDHALASLMEVLAAKGEKEAKIASCRIFADAIFLPPMLKKGAKIWCEKTPRNLLYAESIEKIYPQAKFINVVRDGRDVTSSALKMKFWPVARSIYFPETLEFGGEAIFDKMVNYWTTLIDIGLEQEKKIGPARWLNVRLEDITSDPEATFNNVLNFLEIEKSSGFYDEIRKHIRVKSGNAGRWRQDLTDEQVERFITVSRKNLLHFGYLLD